MGININQSSVPVWWSQKKQDAVFKCEQRIFASDSYVLVVHAVYGNKSDDELRQRRTQLERRTNCSRDNTNIPKLVDQKDNLRHVCFI